jgi:hypothetical protein
MGLAVPAASEDYAIRHAEAGARIAIIVQRSEVMARDWADGQMPADKDIREVYRKIRQMAATHGLDLTEAGP